MAYSSRACRGALFGLRFPGRDLAQNFLRGLAVGIQLKRLIGLVIGLVEVAGGKIEARQH